MRIPADRPSRAVLCEYAERLPRHAMPRRAVRAGYLSQGRLSRACDRRRPAGSATKAPKGDGRSAKRQTAPTGAEGYGAGLLSRGCVGARASLPRRSPSVVNGRPRKALFCVRYSIRPSLRPPAATGCSGRTERVRHESHLTAAGSPKRVFCLRRGYPIGQGGPCAGFHVSMR